MEFFTSLPKESDGSFQDLKNNPTNQTSDDQTKTFIWDASTISQISSPVAASIALKLPEGATAMKLNTFIIPAVTRIYTGGVAGGADTAIQIFIENPSVLIPR